MNISPRMYRPHYGMKFLFYTMLITKLFYIFIVKSQILKTGTCTYQTLRAVLRYTRYTEKHAYGERTVWGTFWFSKCCVNCNQVKKWNPAGILRAWLLPGSLTPTNMNANASSWLPSAMCSPSCLRASHEWHCAARSTCVHLLLHSIPFVRSACTAARSNGWLILTPVFHDRNFLQPAAQVFCYWALFSTPVFGYQEQGICEHFHTGHLTGIHFCWSYSYQGKGWDLWQAYVQLCSKLLRRFSKVVSPAGQKQLRDLLPPEPD